MANGSSSDKVVRFTALFARLKHSSDNDPAILFELAGEAKGISDQCLELLKVAGILQKSERGDRKLFSAPVDPQFISTWRDFEKRFAPVLLSVRSDQVAQGTTHYLSFDWYECQPRWEDADQEAKRVAYVLEMVANGDIIDKVVSFYEAKTHNTASEDSPGEVAEDRFPINWSAFGGEAVEIIQRAHEIRGQLNEELRSCESEVRRSQIKDTLERLDEWGI